MALELKFKKTWICGQQIGEGGFGRVFAATGPNDEPAAIKFVPKSHGSDRELLFVNLGQARNVVPIIDRGETDDAWILVMPRADHSLRQLMEQKGVLEIIAMSKIVVDIATALSDLDGKVVHRDIKPENVLFLNGAWCLADFGIARYAEASTAPDTQKYALSPPYAGPERWRSERATAASDVYSLGVLVFELVTGKLPFPGPKPEDYREQHLHDDPADLKVGPAALRALVSECLYKAQGARPTAANLVARLQKIGTANVSGGLASLHGANLAEVARIAESERIMSVARTAAEQRAALFRSASQSFAAIESALFTAITEAASTARRQPGKRNGKALRLGDAELELFPLGQTPSNALLWRSPVPFDVVAHSGVIVRFPPDRFQYEGRSHSIWFCDAQNEGQYQWFETAFMMSPLVGKTTHFRPFAIDPGEDAAKAFWTGMAEIQLAWPLEPLDTGDLEEFIDRWAGWFAQAANGQLRPPSRMPERDTPSNWRKASK